MSEKKKLGFVFQQILAVFRSFCSQQQKQQFSHLQQQQ